MRRIFLPAKTEAFKLFLISFLILFFELVLIRWLSSYILYLGYFTNFVLLGALLGIGAGTLLADKPYQLIKFLPALLFVFLAGILFTRAQVSPDFEDIIYFTTETGTVRLPAYVLLPVIFISVTVIFTLLSQDLGRLLTRFIPLRAYTLNIIGSLAGIAAFTLMSFLSLPSWAWFLVVAGLLVPFLPGGRSFRLNLILLAGLVGAIFASDQTFMNIWSPYYRLNMVQVAEPARPVGLRRSAALGDNYLLLANGVTHQVLTTLDISQPFYHLPYTSFTQPPVYENALVIGAGGGNDVAVALEHGVRHVDAVEIDPRIVDLGQNYHPEQPYSDPRVTVHVDDARSFLEKTGTKYDLIVFALPDSLVLATSSGSIRLESYLFTLESFQSIKEHLQPNGLFVLYNYYRSDWLIQKITSMLAQVFGQPPVVHHFADPKFKSFATFFAGPMATQVDIGRPGYERAAPAFLTPATDNWPFLYMREPSLPGLYSSVLLLILFFSLVYINRLAPPGMIGRYGLPFFFMGAAFTLLETKSIVQFLLLFGATWLVNSLVFFGVLLVVLIANGLAARYKFKRMWILYLGLTLALALNWAVPLKTFLSDSVLVRYVLATIFLFSPIFFANIIYSTVFRDTTKANVAFGANLLGTMVGGATEYLALYLGYQNLAVVAAIFYFLAFFFIARQQAALIPKPAGSPLL